MLADAALIVGYYRVLLIVGAFDGHGSPLGNVLLTAISLFLLGLSSVIFIVGLINWRLAHASPWDTDN
jgi:hypothetical protein